NRCMSRSTTVKSPSRSRSLTPLVHRRRGGRCLRVVLVRGWPGPDHDDVLFTTDLTLRAGQIIAGYCLRWSLEVTFFETKGKLGFEHTQNRTERAVERTAPMGAVDLFAHGRLVPDARQVASRCSIAAPSLVHQDRT